MAARYARRTNRLAQQQRRMAFEVGGKAGARLSDIVQAPASRDPHLRLVRQAPEPAVEFPGFLGLMTGRNAKGTVTAPFWLTWKNGGQSIGCRIDPPTH